MGGLQGRRKHAPAPTLWLTGRSGAGKTTLGVRLVDHIRRQGYPVQLLDGDIVRNVVDNQDFSPEGRERHLMYMGLFARLLNEQGILAVCTFVSPLETIRTRLRDAISDFHLVYIKCSLEEAMRRDVKGLYRRGTTGIDLFEPPESAELIINTEIDEITTSLDALTGYTDSILHPEIAPVSMPISQAGVL